MGLDRRGFVKIVVGGVAGTLFTPVIWKSLDDVSIWSQNWPWIPRLNSGEVKAKAALSKLCPAGCAVKVKTVGGLPFAVAVPNRCTAAALEKSRRGKDIQQFESIDAMFESWEK